MSVSENHDEVFTCYGTRTFRTCSRSYCCTRYRHASDHSETDITARVCSHDLPADDQRSADTWDSIIEEPHPMIKEPVQ